MIYHVNRNSYLKNGAITPKLTIDIKISLENMFLCVFW